MDIRTLDSFNAKYLDPIKLSETFVPSSDFERVAKNGPALIVGARGSGKTTLLKMLGNEALPLWKHPEAESYRQKIDLEGVYIPADSVWSERIRIMKNSGISEDISEQFSRIAFSTHVYIYTVEAMERSLELKISSNPDYGKEILQSFSESISDIAEYLKINIKFNSLSRIKHALRKRMKFLGEYAKNKSILRKLTQEELTEDIGDLDTDLDFTLESMFDSFDSVFKLNGIKWVVLLDEFEVAPESLQKEIITKLRSTSKKHIYKIALVPCGKHLESDFPASAKNDYDVLPLWRRSFDQNKEFCKGIISSRFKIDNPEEIFGESDFVEAKKIDNNKIRPSFESLYEKDPSFKKYVDAKDLNLNSLFDDSLFSGNGSRENELRKISPNVVFRELFKDSKGNIKRRESLPEFYSGWNAIVKISEGNPRWIMSTVASLFETSKNKNEPIAKRKQAKSISDTTNAFKSMIATTALSDNMGYSTDIPVIELIDKLADYIRKQYIENDFKADLCSTFTIDDKVDEQVINTIRIALNHGAIVSIGDSSEIDIWKYRELRGNRFRLSYLFSPAYKIPMRQEKRVALSSILNTTDLKTKLKVNPLDSEKSDPSKGQIGLDF